MNQNWENEILKLLSESGKALDSFEIAEKTNLDMRALQPVLNALAASGQAALTKKGKYALPETLGLVRAKANALRNGTPIAEPMMLPSCAPSSPPDAVFSLPAPQPERSSVPLSASAMYFFIIYTSCVSKCLFVNILTSQQIYEINLHPPNEYSK